MSWPHRLKDKRPWIDPSHPHLSIQRQCELLTVPRSTWYYQPRPESEDNLQLLRQLDRLYLKRPFYGSRKMAVELEVNRKRIQRLMRILGIEAHYPKPTSVRPAPESARSTRTCCAAWRSSGPTTSGAPILLTFRCVAASYI